MKVSSRARVLLLGLGGTALTALESLLTKFDVLGIVRTAGDGKCPDPVVTVARHAGVPVLEDASASAIDALVERLNPDCVVVSSYNRILKERTLARCQFINVHYSPLPRYRGRANVNWALINGEPFAAVSIHVLAPELDAGNILFQRMVPIFGSDTAATLYGKLNDIQKQNLASTVARFLDGYPGETQDENEATYGCTRIPDDGLIDWTASTLEIDRLVRALVHPFPGAYAFLNGRRLRIWKVLPLPNPPRYVGRIPGRVVAVSSAEGYVDVLTGDGVLRVIEVQHEGQDTVSAAELIKSVTCTLALSVSDLASRIEDLEMQLSLLQARSEAAAQKGLP